MLNSAKNTFEAVDHNVHVFATDLVLLDRSLRNYGPATDVRKQLASYVRQAVAGTWPEQRTPVLDDRAESVLTAKDARGKTARRSNCASIVARSPKSSEGGQRAQGGERGNGRNEADCTSKGGGGRAEAGVGGGGGRGPGKVVVGARKVGAAFLLSATVCVILDMRWPFSGPIQISPEPMWRVEEQLRW